MEEYQVIQADHAASQLHEEVNQALKDGWQLVGGVSCAVRTSAQRSYVGTFCQALKRTLPEPYQRGLITQKWIDAFGGEGLP